MIASAGTAVASVTVELPSMLSTIVGAARSTEIEAATLREAIAAIVERHPGLAVHLFDESGALRQHVLCYHNQVNSRALESLDVPVHDGDTVTILQAVSGG
jgi:molybdopterin converting factor small subunit